jgi:hypothetical protein
VQRAPPSRWGGEVTFEDDFTEKTGRFALVRALAQAGELLALVRHLRPRRVPGAEPPAAAVVERIVQMGAAELRELVQRLREQ